MSENQTSAKSTVEGELGLDDLEKIAGGTGTESLASSTVNFDSGGDTSVLRDVDNVHSSNLAAKGADTSVTAYTPMNMSVTFP